MSGVVKPSGGRWLAEFMRVLLKQIFSPDFKEKLIYLTGLTRKLAIEPV
jgi:hypothetical protein